MPTTGRATTPKRTSKALPTRASATSSKPKTSVRTPTSTFAWSKLEATTFSCFTTTDTLDPDLVEACLDAAGDDTGFGILRSGTRVVDADGKVMAEKPNRMAGLSTTELFLSWFGKDTAIYFCSTLFNTEHLKKAGGSAHQDKRFRGRRRRGAARGAPTVTPTCSRPKPVFGFTATTRGSSVNTVRDWAEDSLYLLEVLREELPLDAERLVKAGQPYLCARLYRYASLLPSWRERAQAFWWSYKLFDYSYSPVKYLSKQQLTRLKGSVRNLVKGQPTGQAA